MGVESILSCQYESPERCCGVRGDRLLLPKMNDCGTFIRPARIDPQKLGWVNTKPSAYLGKSGEVRNIPIFDAG